MHERPPAGSEVRFRVPRLVGTARLSFRPAVPDDAEFILSLRLDESKNKHISPTSPDVEAQRNWLEQCSKDDSQAYFIIETSNGTPVGTVRLYDPQGSSFCWGSWILSDGAPKSSAVETSLMVYRFGLACGFDSAHFDVRKANEKVWQYHERFGARRVREDAENYYYTIAREAIDAAFHRYSDRLPGGIKVEF